jgi:1-acyl-sn-glycerol-3-phosphate acyltransferase
MGLLFVHFFTTLWTLIVAVVVFTLMNIWSIPTFLFSKKLREKLYFIPIPFLTSTLLKIGTLSRITHIDRRNKDFRPSSRLYIANHRSMIDVPLLNTAHPISTLMKFEVLYLPFMILPSLASGAITVKRGDPKSRKKAFMTSVQRLNEGKPVFYFPEGTRAKDGLVKDYQAIHKPLLKSAFMNKSLVIPISVAGTKDLLDKHNLVRPFQKLIMITHDYVDPHHFDNEELFCQKCWEIVTQGVYEAEQLHSGKV